MSTTAIWKVKWKKSAQAKTKIILKDLERKSEVVGLEGWESYYGLITRKVEDKENLDSLIFELNDRKV